MTKKQEKPKKDFFLNKLLSSVALLQELKATKQEDIKKIDTFIQSLLKEMEEEKKKEENKEEDSKKKDSQKPDQEESKDLEQQMGQQETPSNSSDTETTKTAKGNGTTGTKQSKEKEELEKKKQKTTPSNSSIRSELIERMREAMTEGEKLQTKKTEEVEAIPLTKTEDLGEGGGNGGTDDVAGAKRVWCPVCNDYHDKAH